MSGVNDPRGRDKRKASHEELAPTLLGSSTPVTTAISNPAESTGQVRATGSKLGHYVIDGVVGAGGMGVVYAAHDPKLE